VEDLWSERETSPARVEAALRDLLARRHHEHGFVPARVLNLVVVLDGQFRGEVENRLERLRQYHPSRLILCSLWGDRVRLDAWASISAPDLDGGEHRITVGRERVELAIGPKHVRSLDTIVDPLLVPDLATMVWSPHRHPEALDRLRRLAQIVLVDSQDEPDVGEALRRAGDLAEWVYVVDLAWLRSTPWRERVAAVFDPPAVRHWLGEIARVTVRHREDSAATGLLFCGWLASRLGWRTEGLSGRSRGLRGRARARRGEVELALEPVELGAPGLAGVTVEMASGDAVSLDRGPGGLRSARRDRHGAEQAWTVLGASRGESGILGEGVRQALLRDPTYRPALAAARGLVA